MFRWFAIGLTLLRNQFSGRMGGRTFLAREDNLLDLKRVAARLGVSKAWVRDHATRRNPRISVVRLGGKAHGLDRRLIKGGASANG